MFTGIVQQTCPVAEVVRRQDFMSFAVTMPAELRQGLALGASVAINGCCQTVSELKDENVWFDAMKETLDITTLGDLQPGDAVNVERSASFGQEIGGHELSGHVDGKLKIEHIETTADNSVYTLVLPDHLGKYVFNKGYLAVHGASLTVSDLDKSSGRFKVYLIPETLRITNLGNFAAGDHLNLEIDRRTQVIVETVEAYMASQGS